MSDIKELIENQSLNKLLEALPFYSRQSMDACREWLDFLQFIYDTIPREDAIKTPKLKTGCLQRAKGECLNFIYKLLATDKGALSWPDFKAKIQNRFGDPSIQYAATLELTRPRQQGFESPLSFLDRVKNLAKLSI